MSFTRHICNAFAVFFLILHTVIALTAPFFNAFLQRDAWVIPWLANGNASYNLADTRCC